MVNFKNKLKQYTPEKPIDPIEIYDNLDRTAQAGPLRDSQIDVLSEWYRERFIERDIVVKLHTGEGKTLVGLLMLQSKLNKKEGPALYICPNIYLFNQVISEATKFGISYCTLGKGEREIPIDFINQKSILITYVQKLFNGKSIFGLGNDSESVGAIVLDDAHACIESIRGTYTISIPKEHCIYGLLLELFESHLKLQGAGTYYDIKLGHSSDVLQIPYWAWVEHAEQVTEILSLHSEDDFLKFVWPLLRDKIDLCQSFVSCESIEICPFSVDIDCFGSFSRAKHRILMSATTQEDSFFIKDLKFDVNSIKRPLLSTSKKWSGEKMILIPSLIDESLRRLDIIDFLTQSLSKTHRGSFAIVPSRSASDDYYYRGAHILSGDQLSQAILSVKNKTNDNTYVIINRYDGIDLPDSVCRILTLDSLPYCESLSDRYEMDVKEDCELRNRRIAQKIEQGLGRSVRSEKDYSAIILLGPDLVKFVRSDKTSKYFSVQTRKQIEIGLDLAISAKEESSESDSPLRAFVELLGQQLRRDEDWKEYYRQQMDEIDIVECKNQKVLDIITLESKAEYQYMIRNFGKSKELYEKILTRNDLTKNERAWYTQQLSFVLYHISKIDARTTQLEAFSMNHQLLCPPDTVKYKQVTYKNASIIDSIKAKLASYDNYEQLHIDAEAVIADLAYGVVAKKFEKAVYDLGIFLGFESQRPDEEIKKGPDNLWVSPTKYFMIECKSEVTTGRNINKHEAAQMCSHCAWFDEHYPGVDVLRIWMHPSHQLSYESNLTHNVYVIDKKLLDKLKHNFSNFIKEFRNYDLKALSNNLILKALQTNKLDVESLANEYVRKVKKFDGRL